MGFFINLFKPGWMSKDFRKAQSAFNRIKNKKSTPELIRIAVTCPHAALRSAATDLIDDQDTLRGLVLHDPSQSLRVRALERIEDTSFFVSIVDNRSINLDLRIAALKRITDTKIILQLLLSLDKDLVGSEIKKIVESITEQAALEELALHSEHPRLRYYAVAGLAQGDTLIYCATRDLDESVRIAALERITDQSFLRALMEEEKDDKILHIAALKLDDASLLKLCGRHAHIPHLRTAAPSCLRCGAQLSPSSVIENMYQYRFAGSQGAVAWLTPEGSVRFVMGPFGQYDPEWSRKAKARAFDMINSWKDVERLYYRHGVFAALFHDGTVEICAYISNQSDYLHQEWKDIANISLGDHLIGLQRDGKVVATGFMLSPEWYGIASVVAGGSGMAHSRFVAGLRYDGTILAEGEKDTVQLLDSIRSWTGVTYIAAINSGIAAIREDGTAICAYLTYSGAGLQTSVSTSSYVLPFQDLCQISGEESGAGTIYGLTSDGALLASSTDYRKRGEAVEHGQGFTAINNWLALKKDGEIIPLSGSSSASVFETHDCRLLMH